MGITITRKLFPSTKWYRKFLDDAGAVGYSIREYRHDYDRTRGVVLGICDSIYVQQWCERNGLMYLNVYPDMSRKQYTGNDTFVFAAPIPEPTWRFIHAIPGVQRTGDGVAYVTIPDEDVIVIMREKHHTDEDMLTAAAHIRVVDQETKMIYACPAGNLTQTQIINRTAGAPRALCKMLTIDEGDD